jgi:hypothetical protein
MNSHQYMNPGAEASSLTNTLLSAIRLQRHLGTRVFISTQEPTISPKLLDLCSMTIVHRFTSPDWLCELRRHLASLDNDEDAPEKSRARLMAIFNQIVKLRVGEALIFSPSAIIGVEKRLNKSGSEAIDIQRLGIGYLKIKIRARVTSDGGRSVFALGMQPTTKSAGNMFGVPAAKPVSGVPQPVTGMAANFNPATNPVQFPSVENSNNSMLEASYSSAAGSCANSQQGFRAPSSAPVGSNMISPMNTQGNADTAPAACFGKWNVDPFISSERTHITGAFTISTPGHFSMFSSDARQAQGTRCTPFQPYVEEGNSSTNQQYSFQSIVLQLQYQGFSAEELRLADYAVGLRYSGQWSFERYFK